MYDPNAQKDLLILRSELNDCCYDPKMRDYLQGLIIRIMNYPKKAIQCRHFVKIMDQKKIMMIWYPLNILFANKNYSIPIQIYITKNIPYEPPQIFLELKKGTGVNPKNKDIDPKNNRIMAKTLRSWNQNSNIENVLGEIFESFSRLFPIYKKKTDQQIPIPNQAQQGGGGNYGMFQNEMNNSYQKQNSDIGGFKRFMDNKHEEKKVSILKPSSHVSNIVDNKGINIKGHPGAQARSIFDGEVSAVFSFGGTMVVMVRHGSYISVYCNLASVNVHKGQRVSTRQALGRIGQDDILQFQLRRETAKLNPESWLGR